MDGVLTEQWLGKTYSGQITYTKSGFVSVNMASLDPEFVPKDPAWPPRNDSSDLEWAQVAKHTLAYAGVWSISDAIPATRTGGQVLNGPLSVSSVPALRGTTQVRNFTLFREGDKTILKLFFSRIGNVTFYADIWWTKQD